MEVIFLQKFTLNGVGYKKGDKARLDNIYAKALIDRGVAKEATKLANTKGDKK